MATPYFRDVFGVEVKVDGVRNDGFGCFISLKIDDAERGLLL